MRRRDFIEVVAGSTIAWPFAPRAQQTGVSTIGFIGASSPSAVPELVAAFHRRLREMGYTEGQNVRIEYRWGEGQYNRLPTLAVE
jgi:putative tryptophan/tyrosine transport system substrate-binding protein